MKALFIILSNICMYFLSYDFKFPNNHFAINGNNPVRLVCMQIVLLKKKKILICFCTVLYICITLAFKILYYTTKKALFNHLNFFFFLPLSNLLQQAITRNHRDITALRETSSMYHYSVKWDGRNSLSEIMWSRATILQKRQERAKQYSTQKWAEWGWNKTSQKIDE